MPEKLNIRPLRDNVIVEPDEQEDRTKGGIYLPDTARNTVTTGTVIAVGEGSFNEDGTREPMPVKKGDKILYPVGTGLKIDIVDDKKHVLFKHEDVLAIFK